MRRIDRFTRKDEGPIVRHFGCVDDEEKRVRGQAVDKGLHTGFQVHDHADGKDIEGRGDMK